MSNAVECFVNECCLVGPDYRVKPMPLYQAYCAWRERQGYYPVGTSVFFPQLKARLGLRKKETPQGNFYYGIRLKPEGD